MKALILIQGASQQAVETEIKREVHLLGGDNDSITSLQLFATRQADTFALKPNRLSESGDFIGLCIALTGAFDNYKGVHIDAWIQFDKETSHDPELPSGKMLYVDFDYPGHDFFYLVDPKGQRWELLDHTDEETGAEILRAEITGTATYRPYPKMQLNPLGRRIEFGEQSRRRDFRNLWWWLAGKGMITLLIVVVFCVLAILGICAAWDFSGTLLPFSLPSWLPYVVFASAGFVLAVLLVIFKDFNFWEHFWGLFFFSTIAAALAIGVIMTLVFSVNWWFESSEPVYGSGVVTEVEAKGKNGEEPNYSYHVDVDTPDKGTIFIRMYHDGSYKLGDSVTVVFHRGLFGLYHAEKLKHR